MPRRRRPNPNPDPEPDPDPNPNPNPKSDAKRNLTPSPTPNPNPNQARRKLGRQSEYFEKVPRCGGALTLGFGLGFGFRLRFGFRARVRGSAALRRSRHQRSHAHPTVACPFPSRPPLAQSCPTPLDRNQVVQGATEEAQEAEAAAQRPLAAPEKKDEASKARERVAEMSKVRVSVRGRVGVGVGVAEPLP